MPCQGEKQHNGIVTSDEFNASTLSLNWQWNHNPIDEAWSLTDRKGWLRLHTSRPANHIFDAPNTISQRMMGRPAQASSRWTSAACAKETVPD